jgi:hypothetical protein
MVEVEELTLKIKNLQEVLNGVEVNLFHLRYEQLPRINLEDSEAQGCIGCSRLSCKCYGNEEVHYISCKCEECELAKECGYGNLETWKLCRI